MLSMAAHGDGAGRVALALGVAAALLVTTSVAVAQERGAAARFAATFELGLGTVGTASDGRGRGQMATVWGMDLRYHAPTGPGVVGRVRMIDGVTDSPDVGVVLLELGYAHRLVLWEGGTAHSLDASLALAGGSVTYGQSGDGRCLSPCAPPPDLWAFGIGATVAYSFRIGSAAAAIGPWGHVLPLTTDGSDKLHFGAGLAVRLGFDAALGGER